MTVDYSKIVLNQRNRNWVRLLARWKGSLYRLLWPDMIVYFTVYFMLGFYYRWILYPGGESTKTEREYFTNVVRFTRSYANKLPLSLVLAFYVNIIVTRWWNEFLTIPWPDGVALHISTMIEGSDERSRIIRRTMVRYINLSWVLLVGMMSPQVKLRFPTLEHFVQAGLLLPHEKIILETCNLHSSKPKYWVPITWALNMASRARREGRIPDNITLNYLADELAKFRVKLGDLLNYDWIQIPLVYTQAVAIATYSYFFANVMGKQFLKEPGEIDLYVPVFHIFEFFFYMGWMKVAESLINPFGNDDDDFELNYFIDRNFQTGYFIVDDLFYNVPFLKKDTYWDCYSPEEIPYTKACIKYKTRLYQGVSSGRIVKHADDQYISRPFKKERRKQQSDSVKKVKREPTQSGDAQANASSEINEAPMGLKNENPEDLGRLNSVVLKHYHKAAPHAPDLFNRVSLINKSIAERKKHGSLQTSGYWASITGPVLADNSLYYETEFHKRFVRPDQPTLFQRGKPQMIDSAKSRLSDEKHRDAFWKSEPTAASWKWWRWFIPSAKKPPHEHNR